MTRRTERDSELAALREQNDKLLRALAFYMDEDNYPAYYAGAPSKVLQDRGVIARAVFEHVLGEQTMHEVHAEIATLAGALDGVFRRRR